MANKTLVRAMDGTPEQICFRDVTDFSPAAAVDLRVSTPTLVDIDTTGLANGAARQSAKVDLGDPRAAAYKVRAAMELAATPTAGNVIELWWAPSPSATAANANPGGISGSDAAYAGYSSNLDASIKQLEFIGNFICTAQATGTIQIGEVGILVPTERYGTLVIYDKSGAAYHSDAVETHVVFDPIVPELQ